MQTSSLELEQIVRVVMQRLAAGRDLMEGVSEIADVSDLANELVIQDRLVTLKTVDQQLDGKSRLRVQPRAVVTPAVVDLLRSLKIELVRDGQSASQPAKSQPAKATWPGASNATASMVSTQSNTTSKPTSSRAPVLVCGSANWFNSLPRHLCPKQAAAQACEDQSAVGLIERHLSAGGTHAVWLSSAPFTSAVLAGRNVRAASVQLPSLRELADALHQAKPQVLIIDSPRWTVAAVGNLVRSLVRSR